MMSFIKWRAGTSPFISFHACIQYKAWIRNLHCIYNISFKNAYIFQIHNNDDIVYTSVKTYLTSRSSGLDHYSLLFCHLLIKHETVQRWLLPVGFPTPSSTNYHQILAPYSFVFHCAESMEGDYLSPCIWNTNVLWGCRFYKSGGIPFQNKC